MCLVIPQDSDQGQLVEAVQALALLSDLHLDRGGPVGRVTQEGQDALGGVEDRAGERLEGLAVGRDEDGAPFTVVKMPLVAARPARGEGLVVVTSVLIVSSFQKSGCCSILVMSRDVSGTARNSGWACQKTSRDSISCVVGSSPTG